MTGTTDHCHPICLECGVHACTLYCTDCKEEFCSTCFQFLHQNGNRKLHTKQPLSNEQDKSIKKYRPEDEVSLEREEAAQSDGLAALFFRAKPGQHLKRDQRKKLKFIHRCKFIPLRLTFKERKNLRTLNVIFDMSHYTDTVDDSATHASLVGFTASSLPEHQRKTSRLKNAAQAVIPPKMLQTIYKEIYNILVGVITCYSIKPALELAESKSFTRYMPFFKTSFEILRRYKILNPERLKGSYAKILYFLQDTNLGQVRRIFDADDMDSESKDASGALERTDRQKLRELCPEYMQQDEGLVTDIKFTFSFLHEKSRKLLALLGEDDIAKATMAIEPIEFISPKKIAMLSFPHKTKVHDDKPNLLAVMGLNAGGLFSFKRSGLSASDPSPKKEPLFLRRKTQHQITQEKAEKSKAIRRLVEKYRYLGISDDEIEMVLYSIGDYNSFLAENINPIKYLINFLTLYFNPFEYEEGLSLAIKEHSSAAASDLQASQYGSRLSHTHATQFQYIYQTLVLWKAILKSYYELWYYAEQDLINSKHPYELSNTGQGMQRVQHSPRTLSCMQKLILETQKKVGRKLIKQVAFMRKKAGKTSTGLTAVKKDSDDHNSASPKKGCVDEMSMHDEEEEQQNDDEKEDLTYEWVGSSVIHIGDNNVPNALMFIDKYTQISKILNPIVKTLTNLPENVARYPEFQYFIKATYGTVEDCQKHILCDFFKHGFDGSGADNFFDAGSCIDGRLTSAWNWCSLIATKEYYPCFKVCGFLGFDGEP